MHILSICTYFFQIHMRKITFHHNTSHYVTLHHIAICCIVLYSFAFYHIPCITLQYIIFMNRIHCIHYIYCIHHMQDLILYSMSHYMTFHALHALRILRENNELVSNSYKWLVMVINRHKWLVINSYRWL